MSELPVVRSSERMTYKRCPKKWYWKWRKGLVPKAIRFGALDLGTWMHTAFDEWYGYGYKRHGDLVTHFDRAAANALVLAERLKAPEHELEKATELKALGTAMATEYQRHYGIDEDVRVVTAEVPLEFEIADNDGQVIAKHLLKPDLVFLDTQGDAWLMEHKTAGQIRTEHLTIDDQARPYGAMAERALRKKGFLKRHSRFKGIVYNFLRKGFVDERMRDEQGRALNKDGTVSKRQPAPLFKRHRVTMTRLAKIRTLQRIQAETVLITALTLKLRAKEILPSSLPKTPDKSCPRFCEFFAICEAEEQGTDIRPMVAARYRVQNPYADYNVSTEDTGGFM